MKSTHRVVAAVLVSVVIAATSVVAQPGRRHYQKELVETDQQLRLQRALREICRDTPETFVTGPLRPFTDYGGHFGRIFAAVRVVCSDLSSYESTIVRLNESERLEVKDYRRDEQITGNIPGCRGSMFDIELNDRNHTIYVLTVQQLRFLIWRSVVQDHGWFMAPYDQRQRYSQSVSNYLAAIDSGKIGTPPPRAVAMGFPDSLDLYAPNPDYVISGYDNYVAFMLQHRELTTNFATGITAFVPTAVTMELLKAMAPSQAWPNKDEPRLQEEYRDFYERGGDNRSLQTLTATGFDTLGSDEYIFAVSQAGQIRFGRELAPEDVGKIETETGQKPPRINHAFLFPGESVTTAGVFVIDDRADDKLVEVNAHSGHYFYCNAAATVREDIRERSNEYLLTLGHFFIALDRAGIAYGDVLISKL